MVAINTNIASLLAQNNTRQVNNELEKAMERLSSGLRINSAGDDAAGLAISSRMEAQVRGLQAAIKNANDGISVTQVAEGAMEEVGNILQRMRELAVQAANDSNSDADRSYLQAEVSQLAEEITRISETTQFNGQNILDGSYTDKYFQIGANASQNVGLSIANLASEALGIGTTSASASSTSTTTSSTATEEIARIEFGFDDTYSFQLTDRETGLSYQIQTDTKTIAASAASTALDTVTIADHGFRTGDALTVASSAGNQSSMSGSFFAIKIDEDTFQIAASAGAATNGTASAVTAVAATFRNAGLTLNLEDDQSKADFEDRINIGLKESAVNSSITGYSSSNAAVLAQANSNTADGASLDLTTVDADHFSFSLTVDGVTKDIDFLNRAMAAATTDSSASYFEITNGMRNEIQTQFDDSISVSYSTTGVFTIEDGQGRSMSIEQGAGTGYFFGTDTQNSGSLDVNSNVQNNLSVAFDGGDLTINHASAGGVDLTNYTAATATTYNVFSPSNGATSSLTEPVVLADDAVANDVTISGVISDSKIAINFSDTFGYASTTGISANTGLSATYAFKITDGSGNIYAAFTGSNILNIQEINNSDVAIKSAVEARLAAEIGTTFTADDQIDAAEFTVDYNNGILTVSNSMGRDLAIEDFTSEFGTITVSKLDGLEGVETLSSKQAHKSEIRLERGFGTNLAAGTVAMIFNIDSGTAMSVNMAAAFTASATTSGWEQAADMATLLYASTVGDTNMRVAYDSTTDEFVFSDTLGRSIELQGVTTGTDPGQVFVQEASYGAANRANSVDTSTSVVSGTLSQAAQLSLSFSQDTLTNMAFDLNGTALTAVSHNFQTTNFSGSTLEGNLDTLMTTLNNQYNGTAFSYTMDEDNRTLTITHQKGGEIKVSGFTAGNSDLTMAAEVVSGIGDDTVISYYEVLTSASIEGDGTVDGTSTITTSTSTSSSSTTTSGISQITVANQAGANSALASIDNALDTLISERAKLGALENRLDHTINNLSNISTNTSAAKGRILDADFAVETANLTKNQILSQAATSMLAQANQSKQSILALLQ